MQNIQQTENGFTVETTSTTENFSHVIIAVAPHQLKSLTLPARHSRESGNPVAFDLNVQQFTYQPITTIYLQYPKNVHLNSAMTGLTHATSQWLFDRGLLCGQHGLIAVVISANGDHQALNNAELVGKVISEIQQLYPQTPEPIWTKIITEKRATFSCDFSLARPNSGTGIKNLYFAGDFVSSGHAEQDYPATIEGAVRSGIRCAELVINA